MSGYKTWTGPDTERHCAALNEIFGGITSQEKPDQFEIESPEPWNAKALFDACDVLGCTPDQLFTSQDTGQGGGCETCAYDYPILRLEVRR